MKKYDSRGKPGGKEKEKTEDDQPEKKLDETRKTMAKKICKNKDEKGW